MIEYAARLLRFADELEEGAHPRASLLRHGVEAVLTLVGSIDRDASMAGHEGPSSADADELRHQGDKVIQFACALGFDAVDEACDSEEEITTSAAPAAPTRRKRRLEARKPSNKRLRRLCFEEEEEEEEDDVEAGEPDESDLRRRLRCSSTGKLLYRGRVEEGSNCPANVAKKLEQLAEREPVGIVKMLAASSETPGGMPAVLRAADGLRGLKDVVKDLGGDLSINLLNQGGAEVLEGTVGECNNGGESFHQDGANTKTAKIHRASQATLKVSTSGTSVLECNINYGGCAAHVGANGRKHCALLPDYSSDLREAMEQTTLVAYEKVAETFPDAKVLLVSRFGNYVKRKHTGRDGTPLVTMEVETEGGMIVLSAVSKHLSLAPGDTDALVSILEARAALRAGGERVLEWRKGELDLEGLLDERTDADRREAVLEFLEILVTAQQEPAEYRGGLDAAKTQEMVQMIEDLRGEESLDAVLAGAEEIAKMWMPRGYTAKNRSDGGTKNNFGLTAGETVAGALAQEAAARADVDAADSDEPAAAVAKQKLHEATEKRKLVETARDDQARGGKTGGAQSSTPGFNGLGKPFNSGHGARARDFSAESSGDSYYGLHVGRSMKDLRDLLPLLVQPDGRLKDTTEEPLPLCDKKVKPGYPGLTRAKGTFGLDRDGNVILRCHDGATGPTQCTKAGAIPVVTMKPPHRVPRWAVDALREGKVVSNKVHNANERKLATQNQG